MSTRLFEDDVVFLQRLLKSAGFYADVIDGAWGPNTDRAVKDCEARCDVIRATLGAFDDRTERNIRSLHPKAQESARRFLRKLIDHGIDARIISGTRTYAEQNALFRQGRFGNPGPKVTNARGGQSNHNFGIAWDIGLFEGGRYLTDAAPYEQAAAVGLIDGVEWGGNWRTFKDLPHYQMSTGLSLSELRVKFERGEVYL